MSRSTTPISVAMQPGKHLSIDSRPGTAESREEIRQSAQSQSVDRFIHCNSSHLVNASIYITSPFKQGPQKRYQGVRKLYDVSSPIKQEVAQSLSIYKQITSYKDVEEPPLNQRAKTFHGRQNQGRLMPLLGVPAVKGPAMKQCIGILAGNKKPSRASKSRHKTCYSTERPKMISACAFNSL